MARIITWISKKLRIYCWENKTFCLQSIELQEVCIELSDASYINSQRPLQDNKKLSRAGIQFATQKLVWNGGKILFTQLVE